MLQSQQTLKTLKSVKDVRHKSSHIVWFYLYKIFRIGKLMEIESQLVVTRGWGKRTMSMAAQQIQGFLME